MWYRRIMITGFALLSVSAAPKLKSTMEGTGAPLSSKVFDGCLQIGRPPYGTIFLCFTLNSDIASRGRHWLEEVERVAQGRCATQILGIGECSFLLQQCMHTCVKCAVRGTCRSRRRRSGINCWTRSYSVVPKIMFVSMGVKRARSFALTAGCPYASRASAC